MNKTLYNVYCDESCHLENDNESKMVLGALFCPFSEKDRISKKLKEIKKKYGLYQKVDNKRLISSLNAKLELKWSRISNIKKDLYIEIVKYFFDEDCLQFRCLVADKTNLKHSKYAQSHDDWYYKMYYLLLMGVLKPEKEYKIFVDIKDNRGIEKLDKVKEYLKNKHHDINLIKSIKHIRSHESVLLQLSDILIGAVGYVNRQIYTNTGKIEVAKYIRERSGYSLLENSPLSENKFNIFHWKGNKQWNSLNE